VLSEKAELDQLLDDLRVMDLFRSKPGCMRPQLIAKPTVPLTSDYMINLFGKQKMLWS